MDRVREVAWGADVPPEAKLLLLALAEGKDLPAAAQICRMRYIHAILLARMLADELLIDETCRIIIPEPPERPDLSPPPYAKAYIPLALRTAVYERDGYACVYCGRDRAQLAALGRRLSIDHKLAEWKGGETEIENLVTACDYCNASKGTSSAPRNAGSHLRGERPG